MPLCGFDEQMLDGLDMFCKGLTESVTRRSSKEGITIETAIELELNEIGEFTIRLHELDDGAKTQRLIGLANYAQSFYQRALQRSRDGIAVSKAMETEMSDTRKFLYETDRKYYEELKGKVPEPIKVLVAWINDYGGM